MTLKINENNIVYVKVDSERAIFYLINSQKVVTKCKPEVENGYVVIRGEYDIRPA